MSELSSNKPTGERPLLEGQAQSLSLEQRKQKIQEAHSRKEQYYRTAIDSAFGLQQNETTLIKSIQASAREWEEIFVLHDQEWFIDTIASIIYNDLLARDLPRDKAKYVYDALSPFGTKYIKLVEHSSVRSSDKPDKRLEHFYTQNKQDMLELIQKAINNADPGLFRRSDFQDIGSAVVDLYDRIDKEAKRVGIPIFEMESKKGDNFDSGPDKFAEKIPYPPTTPAKTILSEAMIKNGKVRIKVGENIEQEGIIDPSTGKQLLDDDELRTMAESVDMDTHYWEPFNDRKWKRDQLRWFEIVEDAYKWFKHSASRKFNSEDLWGMLRDITREQIGAQQKRMKPTFENSIKLFPHMFLLSAIWYAKARMPRGALFSNKLSPKLSDRSLR